MINSKLLEKVNEEIIKIIREKIKVDNSKIWLKSIEFLEDFVLRGGKRLRPIVFLKFCEGFGKDIDENAIRIACSIELFHNFGLIHDDIVDRDDVRRGKPTIHKLYEKFFLESKLLREKEWFGISMAIFLGDLTFNIAKELLEELKVSEEKKISIIRVTNKVVEEVIAGEMLDIYLSYKKIERVNLDDVLKMYILKTASYTFYNPIRVAEIYSDIEKSIARPLGEATGIAFQIRDDLLTLFGKEEKVGKKIYNDLIEGKKTYPIILLYNSCSNSEKKIIEDIMDKKNISEENINKILDLMEKYEIKDNCEKKINECVNKAFDILKENKDLFLKEKLTDIKKIIEISCYRDV